MENDLENLLARLKAQASPALTGLETRVWAKIGDRARAPAQANLWGWRSAVAALLLALGVLTQAGASVHTSEFALFTPRTAIAPSTLLGEDR